MNKNKKIIILSLIIIAFFTLGLMVKGSAEGILFDVKIIEYLHNNTNPLVLKVMKLISYIGSHNVILPGAAMLLSYNLIKKKNLEAKLIILSTAGSWILNFILKQVFQRTRPLEYFLVEQGGYSFPSGHSMVTMTFLLTISYILNKNLDDEKKKKWINLIIYSLIILMGISRVYLGVHWPTDVIGGYLIGYIFYYLSINLIKQ